MKLTATRGDLAKAIAVVSRVAPSRAALPVLSNLLLVATADGLNLTATDLDIGIEVACPALVSDPGSITLPAKKLHEIVTKLPEAPIDIAIEDYQALITCKRSKFTVPTLPADEYPKLLASAQDDATVVLPAAELARGIRQTLFATSKDDKSVIAGLLLRVHDAKLEIVGTDGYRLAWWRAEGKGEGDLEAIIPSRAMGELSRLLDGGEVTVARAGNQIAFRVGDRLLTSRVIDGTFPAFERIIPPEFKYGARMGRDELLGAVERAGIMASEIDGHAICLGLDQGELGISGSAAALGQAQDTLAIEYDGEPMEIRFNARYVEEALRAVDGEAITLRLNGAVQAALIEGSDPLYVSLLMPIQG